MGIICIRSWIYENRFGLGICILEQIWITYRNSYVETYGNIIREKIWIDIREKIWNSSEWVLDELIISNI